MYLLCGGMIFYFKIFYNNENEVDDITLNQDKVDATTVPQNEAEKSFSFGLMIEGTKDQSVKMRICKRFVASQVQRFRQY